MSENLTDLTSENFSSTIKDTEIPVLVDFWAPWCGPCKAITPILEEIAEEMPGKVKICKVNVDENGSLAGEYNVRAIPNMILFKKGEVVEQLVGMTSKEDLVEKINAHA
ncbi:MAG: thioredoxin [Opitutales bacterium]|nr:thioredoxin [Opitutales bacterium]MCH8540688.1 thioredoxin [Opitutales bacterium]